MDDYYMYVRKRMFVMLKTELTTPGTSEKNDAAPASVAGENNSSDDNGNLGPGESNSVETTEGSSQVVADNQSMASKTFESGRDDTDHTIRTTLTMRCLEATTVQQKERTMITMGVMIRQMIGYSLTSSPLLHC